jgi:flagellar L-ring protein FlgH
MSDIKRLFVILGVLLMAVSSVDCSSFGKKLKNLVGGGGDSQPYHQVASNGAPPPTSFSSQPNVQPSHERRYKRVTKDNFADEQAFEENAGSLWRREGQGSYLFSQNNLRNLGDIINVDVEGKAAENLTSKLTIIKQAIARLEAPPIQPRLPASKGGASKTDKQNAQAQGAPDNQQAPQPENNAGSDGNKATGQKFDTVPCRIVEKNSDGSYRVKGQTPVYVGRREYRLIVLGIVRPDDISTDTIPSSKMLDGRFDLVATMKSGGP